MIPVALGTLGAEAGAGAPAHHAMVASPAVQEVP